MTQARSSVSSILAARGEQKKSKNRLVALFVLLVLSLFASVAEAHGGHGKKCHPQPENVWCGPGSTLAKGQQRIDQGRYVEAVSIFSCVMQQNPLEVDAYRGRIEAQLLLGRYSDALRDYAQFSAYVWPQIPDAPDSIVAGYQTRLAQHPHNRAALIGASFAYWWLFDYEAAQPLLDTLVDVHPWSVYGHLFRGSNLLFLGTEGPEGHAELDAAISFAPFNPHVRFIVADAYTYAFPDAERALEEAEFALEAGLDTPRIHAILAAAYKSSGDEESAAFHLAEHIDIVASQIVSDSALNHGQARALALVPGRVFSVPVAVEEGETVTLRTASPSGEIGDTILVIEDANGQPVIGSDDFEGFFAGLDWAAPESGAYTIRVTSFEAIGTGELVISRD
ncbi:MAG: hypothetical protein IPK82_36595 [Polyangiaceae bacterium]|nr:hypothetical protein [Polyangiaceae bacterium]